MSEKKISVRLDTGDTASKIKQLESSLNKLESVANKTSSSFEKLASVVDKQMKAISKIDSASVVSGFDKINTASKTMATSMTDSKKSANAVEAALTRLEKQLSNLVAAQNESVKAKQLEVTTEKQVVDTMNASLRVSSESYQQKLKEKLLIQEREKAMTSSLKKEVKQQLITEGVLESTERLSKAKKTLTAEEKIAVSLKERQAKAEALLQAAQDGSLEATLRAEAAAKQAKNAILEKDEALKKLHGSSVATKDDLMQLEQGFTNASKAVVLALGPLSGVAARITAFNSLLKANTGSIALFVGAITAMSIAMTKVVTLGTALERQMLVFGATLEATGRSAETTANQLNGIAEAFEAMTLASLEGARSAIGALMTFNDIAVDSFNDVLMAAQGVSEVFGGDLVNNTRLIARAIEEPSRNLDSLRRIGIQFTNEQREMIRVFESVGLVAEAQAIIWERLGVFQEVAEGAAKGLSGAMDTLGSNIQKAYESASQNINTTEHLAEAVNAAADAVKTLSNNQDALKPLMTAADAAVKAFANTVVFLADNFETVTLVASAMSVAIGVKAVASLATFATASTAASLGMTTLAASIQRVSAVAAPWLFGIGLIGGALVALSMRANDTIPAADRYAEAMKRIGNDSEFAANRQKLLEEQVGLTGSVLTSNLKALLEKEKEANREYAESFDGLISEIVASMDKYTNAMTMSMDLSASGAAFEMIDTYQSVAEKIQELGREFEQSGYKSEEFLIGLLENLDVIETKINSLSTGTRNYAELGNMGQILETLREAAKQAMETANRVGELEDQINDLDKSSVRGTFSLEAMSKVFKDVFDDSFDLSLQLGRLVQGSLAQANATEASIKAFEEYRKQIKDTIKDEEQRAEILSILEAEQARLEYRIRNAAELQRQYTTQVSRDLAQEISRRLELSQATEGNVQALNDLYKAQDSAAAAINRLNLSGDISDSRQRLAEFVDQMTSSLEVQLNPALKVIIESMGEVGESFSGTQDEIDSLNKMFLEFFKTTNELENSSKKGGESIDKYAQAFLNLRRSLDPVFAIQQEYADNLEIIANGTQDAALQEQMRGKLAAKAYDDIKSSLDPLYAAELQYQRLRQQIIASVKDLAKQQELLNMAEQRYRNSLITSLSIYKGINESLDEQKKQLGMTSRELALYQIEQQYVNQAVAAGVEVEYEHIAALREKAGVLYDTRMAQQEYESQMRLTQQIADNLANSIMGGFEAMTRGGDSFRDWFKGFLRMLALDAIKQRIVVPIVYQSMGIPLGNQAASSQIGLRQALGVASPALAGAGGTAGMLGLGGSLLMGSGNEYGNMVSGVGGWIGGSSPIAGSAWGNYLGGSSANAANAANWQYGVGNFAGGAAANMMGLSGEYSDITGALGGIAGAMMGGPVGAAIGTFLGSAVGGLFTSDPNRKIKGSFGSTADYNETFLSETAGQTITRETAFGNIYLRATKGTVGDYEELADYVMNVDNFLASYAGDKIDEVIQVIDGFKMGGARGDQNNFMTFIGHRYKEILQTIDEDMFDYALTFLSLDGEYASLLETINTSMGRSTKGSKGHPLADMMSTEQLESLQRRIDAQREEAMKNMDEFLAENMHAIAMTFGGLLQASAAGLDIFADTFMVEIENVKMAGEEVYDTLIRLGEGLMNVNPVMDMLGLALFDISVAGADSASKLIALFEGVEGFAESTSSYFNNFFSEQEKMDYLFKQLTVTFSNLGMELPTTVDGFRSLVESLDLTTEAGQAQFKALMDLNPAVYQLMTGMERLKGTTEDLTQVLLNNLDQAMRDVTDAVNREKSALTASYNSQRQIIDQRLKGLRDELALIRDQERALEGVRRIVNLLTSTANNMVLGDLGSRMQRRQSAQEFLQSSLVTARAGGGLPDIDALQTQLRAIQEPSEDMFATFEEYALDFLKTKKDIEGLASVAEDQLTMEEQLLRTQRTMLENNIAHQERLLVNLKTNHDNMMAKLDEQLASARDMYNAALGIDGRLMSVAESIDALRDAINALNNASKPPTSEPPIDMVAQTRGNVNEMYRLFGRTADVEGLEYWTNAIHSGSATIRDLDWALQQAAPKFADGGIHSGGWAMVGERGREMVYTPPSQVFSNNQTEKLIDNSELVEELKAMREELNNLRYETVQIVLNTSKSSRILEDVTQDGTELRVKEVE